LALEAIAFEDRAGIAAAIPPFGSLVTQRFPQTIARPHERRCLTRNSGSGSTKTKRAGPQWQD
jgi:hypothetical protein